MMLITTFTHKKIVRLFALLCFAMSLLPESTTFQFSASWASRSQNSFIEKKVGMAASTRLTTLHGRMESLRLRNSAIRMRQSGPSSTGSSGILDPRDDLLHFNSFQDISSRIDILRERQVKYLGGFYNKDLKCFQHSATANQRVSISSTCLGVAAMFKNSDLWTGIAAPARSAQYCLTDIREALAVHWRMGPLFAPPLLLAMMRLGEHANNTNMMSTFAQTVLLLGTNSGMEAEKLPKSMELYLRSNATGTEFAEPAICFGQGTKNTLSTYLMYWNTKALVRALQTKDREGNPYICPEQLGELSLILEPVSRYAVDELCRQLAFHYAGDKARFDVIQLAYALLIHFLTSGTASNLEHCMAAGVIKMPPLNMKVVEKALAVIFGEQMDDGLWPQGAPIDPVGDKLRGDVGNSFVFSFDLLGSLLEIGQMGHSQLFRQYIPHVERTLKWAEDNIVESAAASGPAGDPFATPSAAYLRGWRSNHLRGEGGPIMWCTAQVFSALSGMRDLLKELKNTDILQEFGGWRSDGDADPKLWNQLLDADLVLGGEPTFLKLAISKHLIDPLVHHQSRDPLRDMSELGLKPSSAKYSMILYGPPGTAKTTICTSIAKRLGWSFVTIDTSNFLADGLGHVASRMAYVFDRLRALERCVILFDEVEEFCLDREDKSLSMESRMLTTAMLTQLNELRRQQKCVFIVATNRLRSFDAAVTRPGRFDLILQVGTPGLQDRCRRLDAKLEAAGLADATQPVFDPHAQALVDARAADLARTLLRERWGSDVRFLNFAENEVLLDEIVALVRRRILTRETFSAALGRLMQTATIQGAVKEEFISSMLLSRVS